MDRLTEKFKDGRNILRKGISDIFHVGFGRFFAGEAVDRLADYEDLEEQGKLLKLPCAVGDTVWCVQMYSGGGRVPDWGEVHQSKFSIRMYDDFGKTVFLTRKEVESALKELLRSVK